MIDSNLNVNSTLNVSFLNNSKPIESLKNKIFEIGGKDTVQRYSSRKPIDKVNMEQSECEAEITANYLHEV